MRGRLSVGVGGGVRSAREAGGKQAQPAACWQLTKGRSRRRPYRCGKRSFAPLPAPWLSSLRFDAGGLDDGPPLLDLGLMKRSKRLRRLLVTRRNFEPEIAQAMAHSRVSHRIHSSAIEGGDDSFRSAVVYPQGVPDRNVKAAPAGLAHSRHIARP